MTTRTSPVRCGRKHVKAKLIIGLTQVGTGTSAKLMLKEGLWLDAKSVHPRACMRTDLTAQIGFRSTATTQLP